MVSRTCKKRLPPEKELIRLSESNQEAKKNHDRISESGEVGGWQRTKCKFKNTKGGSRADSALDTETIWQQSEVWARVLWSTWLVWTDDRCALAAAKRLTSSCCAGASCRDDRREGDKQHTWQAQKASLCSSSSGSFYWYIHCRTSSQASRLPSPQASVWCTRKPLGSAVRHKRPLFLRVRLLGPGTSFLILSNPTAAEAQCLTSCPVLSVTAFKASTVKQSFPPSHWSPLCSHSIVCFLDCWIIAPGWEIKILCLNRLYLSF